MPGRAVRCRRRELQPLDPNSLPCPTDQRQMDRHVDLPSGRYEYLFVINGTSDP
jgi:hypothetical protein